MAPEHAVSECFDTDQLRLSLRMALVNHEFCCFWLRLLQEHHHGLKGSHEEDSCIYTPQPLKQGDMGQQPVDLLYKACRDGQKSPWFRNLTLDLFRRMQHSE